MFREKKKKFATMQNITSAKRGGDSLRLIAPARLSNK